MKRIMALVPILGLLSLSACITTGPTGGLSQHNGRDLPTRVERSETLGTLTYRATEQLIQTARAHVDPGSTVLVTTLVDVDNLQRSSTFGRVVGGQIASRLVQMGYVVPEVRLAGTLVIREGTGEIVLSRDIEEVGRAVNAQVVVVGTYGVGHDWVHVNLRMVAAETGRVVSSVDMAAPMNADMKAMTRR